MMAVRIEMGISEADRERASVSMTIMSADPSSSDTGMTARLFCPHSMRAQCGTSRPTQPTWPHIEMTEAVMTVEATMRIARMRETLTPAERASSSERERILSCQRSATITTTPAMMKGAPSAIWW